MSKENLFELENIKQLPFPHKLWFLMHMNNTYDGAVSVNENKDGIIVELEKLQKYLDSQISIFQVTDLNTFLEYMTQFGFQRSSEISKETSFVWEFKHSVFKPRFPQTLNFVRRSAHIIKDSVEKTVNEQQPMCDVAVTSTVFNRLSKYHNQDPCYTRKNVLLSTEQKCYLIEEAIVKFNLLEQRLRPCGEIWRAGLFSSVKHFNSPDNINHDDLKDFHGSANKEQLVKFYVRSADSQWDNPLMIEGDCVDREEGDYKSTLDNYTFIPGSVHAEDKSYNIFHENNESYFSMEVTNAKSSSVPHLESFLEAARKSNTKGIVNTSNTYSVDQAGGAMENDIWALINEPEYY